MSFDGYGTSYWNFHTDIQTITSTEITVRVQLKPQTYYTKLRINYLASVFQFYLNQCFVTAELSTGTGQRSANYSNLGLNPTFDILGENHFTGISGLDLNNTSTATIELKAKTFL